MGLEPSPKTLTTGDKSQIGKSVHPASALRENEAGLTNESWPRTEISGFVDIELNSRLSLPYTQSPKVMISLHRLSGEPFVLNADWIKTVESTPDTRVVLLNGDLFLVKESTEEVVEKVKAYRREVKCSI